MKLPTLKAGHKHVYRAQLDRMDDGRLFCVACCSPSPNPYTDDFETWVCAEGHPYWYKDELSPRTALEVKAAQARLKKLSRR